MTLLIAVFAALITTLIWYMSERMRSLKIGTLALAYWGASLMWLCDAIFEYAELRADYFTPAAEDMINDAFLGFAVVAFGMILWIGAMLIKDPDHVVRKALFKKG